MKYVLAVLLQFVALTGFFAQENNSIWKGNKQYRDRNYEEAAASYQNSVNLSPSNTASYNMANALYRQQKYKEAGSIYQSIANAATDKTEKAEAYHNLGNAMLKSKDIDRSIAAYKSALRNNPNDDETRYNLSYAMHLKKQQEEKDDQQKDDKKDQKRDQDQQKQDQDQQKQDQDQQKQDQDQKEQKQQQPQPNEVSKEDAARMLQNLQNEEEKTQEKLQLQQRKTSKVTIENDW